MGKVSDANELLVFLHYEVWMLRETHEYLKLGRVISDQVIKNALIESYLVHARNLMEFFDESDPQGLRPTRCTSKDFSLETRFVALPLYHRINEQISHLTHRRTKDASKKIGDSAREEIRGLLETEIAKFAGNLKTQFQEEWALKFARV